MQKNVILVVAVIASLLVGGGGVYVTLSRQIRTLTNENLDCQTQIDTLSSREKQLKSQVTSLTDEKTTLETTLETQESTLNATITSLQTQLYSQTSNNTALATRYDLLAESIDSMHSTNRTQTVTLNIAAGAVMTEQFVLDKYGTVWEVVLDFSGTLIRVEFYYWYNGERYYVSSYSKSLTINNNPDITYYGSQDYLEGTIQLDLSLDPRIVDRIWVNYSFHTRFHEVRVSGNSYVDVSS